MEQVRGAPPTGKRIGGTLGFAITVGMTCPLPPTDTTGGMSPPNLSLAPAAHKGDYLSNSLQLACKTANGDGLRRSIKQNAPDLLTIYLQRFFGFSQEWGESLRYWGG